jgi:glycosyltransferase involved in cell wall biosynthesis
MNEIEFSIVTPAYNEQDKITSTLTQMISFMREFNPSFEIIISNDGSTDKTASLVTNYSQEVPEVQLLDNPHKGKGYAIWNGIMHAKGKYIYVADADLSAPMPELKKLFVWLTDHDYDVVIGTREGIGARRVGEPFIRHLMGRIFNYWIQIIALPGLNDTQCGFKLFKGDAARDIFKRFVLYGENTKITNKAYLGSYDVEALYIARKLKYKIKEVPVTWTYVKTTRLSHIRDSIKMAWDVLRIKVNGILGKYTADQKTSTIA